jgi:Hypervirulence associated proteins TUDOR domain
MTAFRKGSAVKWAWGQGEAEGKVLEVHKEHISKTIKGSTITRNGSDDNPALLIEQSDGDQVLKLSSEVESA